MTHLHTETLGQLATAFRTWSTVESRTGFERSTIQLVYVALAELGGAGDEIERLRRQLGEEAAARQRVTDELVSLRVHVQEVLRQLSGDAR